MSPTIVKGELGHDAARFWKVGHAVGCPHNIDDEDAGVLVGVFGNELDD